MVHIDESVQSAEWRARATQLAQLDPEIEYIIVIKIVLSDDAVCGWKTRELLQGHGCKYPDGTYYMELRLGVCLIYAQGEGLLSTYAMCIGNLRETLRDIENEIPEVWTTDELEPRLSDEEEQWRLDRFFDNLGEVRLSKSLQAKYRDVLRYMRPSPRALRGRRRGAGLLS